MIKEKRNILIIAAVVVYLFSAGASYAVYNFLEKSSRVTSLLSQDEENDGSRLVLDTSGPRDQECLLNGAYFTKAEREIWEKRRPLTVMIENHQESRPQSGLSQADVIYEVVAEGGITRFLAIFYCGVAAGSSEPYNIGPVRSARTYFLDWASEYGDYPLYGHVGGAGQCNDPTVYEDAKALCQIGQYGWKNEGTKCDMDQFALPYTVCRREPERTGQSRATEHTMYCDTSNLWKIAAQRGLTNKTQKTGDSWNENFRSWLFKEEADLDEREEKSPKFSFWNSQSAYNVSWQYNKEENIYERLNDGQPHKDFLSDQQLTAKVVVIQFAREQGPVDDHQHLIYQTIDSGQAIIFQDGQAVKGTWEKESRTTRTRFFDNSDREIRFDRGQIWIEVLPAGNKVTY